jgi:hypothetical protein
MRKTAMDWCFTAQVTMLIIERGQNISFFCITDVIHAYCNQDQVTLARNTYGSLLQ